MVTGKVTHPVERTLLTTGMVDALNDSVRGLADREGATLVDIYAAMIGDLSLIGPDDLHPTAQGHVVMAQTFFTAIKSNFEQTTVSSLRKTIH